MVEPQHAGSAQAGGELALDLLNGWGLKFPSDKDNLAFLSLVADKALRAPVALRKRYVLEGGSIESDGDGTILTTSECMLDALGLGGMGVGRGV